MTMQISDFNHSSVFEDNAFNDHEQIVFCHDKPSGLKAIIALHSTTLGPAMGGTRFWNYATSHEALTDVLRLSQGMTYKNALAGIPFGGGKAVIIGDARTDKTEALLLAFGRHVEGLAGRYITAEDVGISSADMETVSRTTRFARGTDKAGLGDPSPYTALGVYYGIRASVKSRYDQDDITGMTFAVQGLGAVGYGVAQHLHRAGGRLIVADINQAAIDRAIMELGADTTSVDHIHAADCDVFVPCALGAGLNEVTIPQIRAGAVAGAANNQLATPSDGKLLRDRNILYAPDYVINAGGVISIALGKPDQPDTETVERIRKIGDTLTDIFDVAGTSDMPTGQVADRMADRLVSEASANPGS